jgi:hypothetical protein
MAAMKMKGGGKSVVRMQAKADGVIIKDRNQITDGESLLRWNLGRLPRLLVGSIDQIDRRVEERQVTVKPQVPADRLPSWGRGKFL